jgi:hypothetical protein
LIYFSSLLECRYPSTQLLLCFLYWCNIGKKGGVSYKQLKEAINIDFLLCRYEKLIEAVVEGESMSMLQKKTIIDVFEKSTKRFCEGVSEHH